MNSDDWEIAPAIGSSGKGGQSLSSEEDGAGEWGLDHGDSVIEAACGIGDQAVL